MEIKTVRLGKEMAGSYLDFFDHRAFSDGNIQKGCYCVWHHWTEKHEYERSLLPEDERPFAKRAFAEELIRDGLLNGFAAFHGEQMIGFCNADDKAHYFRLNEEKAPNDRSNDRVFSVVCFTVAPEMRGKGVATALLGHACRYAEKNGYDFIEGYPPHGDFTVSDCGGPASMYEKQGFEIVGIPGGIIARKKLK